MSEIRIIIADDDVDFADELSDVLSRHPAVVIDSLVTSVNEVLERLVGRPPDVVIMDIDLAGLDASDLVESLSRQQPRTRVLLLSAHDDPQARAECAETGAVCLPKDLDPTELLRAVTALASGASLVTPDLLARTDPHPEDLGRDPEIPRRTPVELTPRERQVLDLFGEGRTLPDIASALSSNEAIVANHVANIRRRLHVADDVDIVAAARALGLME